mgnify:CR=1 FL=1
MRYDEITCNRRKIPLLIYLFVVIFSDNTYYYYIGSLIFVAYEIPYFLRRHIIKRDLFNFNYVIIIGFFLICICCGFAYFPNIALKRCVVMTINFIINAFVAKELSDTTNREQFLNNYCVFALIFELYLVIFSGNRILLGRLGTYAYSPIAFGGTYNSNIVGVVLLYAIILTFKKYLDDRNRIRLFVIIIYLVGIFLTGSRKAIVATAIIFILLPSIKAYFENRKFAFKIIKYIVLGVGISCIGLFFLFKIPVLYNIAGYRIEAMIVNMGNSDMYLESSLDYRNQFVEYAKQYFYESPFVGIGIDNFAQVNYIKGYYAHNNYWELLSGGGIIGCVLYYLLYVQLFFKLKKSCKMRIQDANSFLCLIIIMFVVDYYMVSYLQHICVLFLFIANAVANSHRSENLAYYERR